MNSRAIRKLTAAILTRQVETGRYGTIPEDRMREAMTRGPELNQRERSLLLLSSVARDDWNRVRMAILEETRDQLHALHIDTELFPLAAAAEIETGQVYLPGSGFSVTLYDQNDQGIPWVILVQLEPNFREAIHPMTRLRLVDAGGLEWLQGRPDANGEITAAWLERDVDLYARACKYSLSLEPV